MAEEAVIEVPEVQPEATPEQVAPEPESTPEQDSEEKKADKTFTQEQLDEILEKRLAKERRKMQREVNLEAENRELKARLQQQEPQNPKEDDGKPTPDKFNTYEEYLDKLTDWKLQDRQNKEAEERQQQTEKQREAELQKKWTDNTSKARDKYSDFDEVIDQDLPMSKPMLDAILDSDVGADIAYYLGKNPAEAHRIAALHPTAALREIGKLELKVSTQPETSKAPPPIKTVGSRGGATNSDPSKMSMEEYAKWRREQKPTWARR